MGGFGSIVRGALAGLNDAAGNPDTAKALRARQQQINQAHMDQLRAQIAPHGIAIKGLQERLQALDPSDPHYADQKAILTNDIARNLAEVRGILYPSANPQGNFFERGITDKLHLTSMKNRQDRLKAQQEKGQKEDRSSAEALATGQTPFSLTPKAQELAYQRETQKEIAEARQKSNFVNFRDPKDPSKEVAVDINREDPPAGWVRSTNDAANKPMSDYQRASLDYRSKLLALQDAKFKASQDPNSPQTKAALLRASQEAERSAAYMIRAQASAFGSYNGKPLTGALETPEGRTVGSMFAGNYFKSAQALSQLNDAQGAIDATRNTIKNLYNSGSSLNNPAVATALANPEWTSSQLLQGIAGQMLTPEETDAVVAIKSARENIQGMRKAAGGGLSNEQVNRLEAQLPGPNTPNIAFADKQLDFLNQTLNRLSKGVPQTVGGPQFKGHKELQGTRDQQKQDNSDIDDIVNALKKK